MQACGLTRKLESGRAGIRNRGRRDATTASTPRKGREEAAEEVVGFTGRVDARRTIMTRRRRRRRGGSRERKVQRRILDSRASPNGESESPLMLLFCVEDLEKRAYVHSRTRVYVCVFKPRSRTSGHFADVYLRETKNALADFHNRKG